MTLDSILEEWDKDSTIDPINLGEASLRIPNLHAKWLRILSYERMRFVKIESEMKVLRLEKQEFYTQGPTRETQEKGWQLPAIGRILNKDLQTYLDADPDIIQMNLRVSLQHEIVKSIELIMKQIDGRNWQIGRAIDFAKMQAGN